MPIIHSVVSLHERLAEIIEEIKAKGRDPAEWAVVMRHDLDGDVVIGANITQISLDGFYQHVNLIGPMIRPMESSDGKDQKEG